ncbi:MAG: Uma2 family endonuclease [Tepidisphaeraceae bacterium]
MIQSLRSVKPLRMDEPAFPLSVEQYHEMIRAGIITDDDPVELLEGGLVFRMGKNPPHSVATQKLFAKILTVLPGGWACRVQEPVTLEDGEPEPDAAIVRGRNEDYFEHHPGPSEAAVVIEVSDSTLSRDRGIKLRSYARAGVQAYWIVNLIDRQVEVYTRPVSTEEVPTYAEQQVFTPGQTVPVVLDGQTVVELAVSDILP